MQIVLSYKIIEHTKSKVMSENLARDQKYFNCSEEHELKYVSGKYADQEKVYQFLVESCKNNKIHYSTHMEVYQLIEKELGYPIPIKH